MRLVVGLGNPGREYEATRHNAGFWWVRAPGATRTARRCGMEPRFHGLAGTRERARHASAGCCEPATFMNASGRAVAALARFYKIAPEEMLVVHDELDLPPGGVKLKKGGGAAGHNGLKDIIAHLGPGFLAAAHRHRPSRRSRAGDRTTCSRRRAGRKTKPIDEAIERSLDVWPLLLEGKTEAAMLKLHTTP